MIRILSLLVLLFIGLLAAAMIFDDRGYVFVEFSGWIFEMNVYSLAFILIGIFISLLLLSWLIKKTVQVASGSKNWLGSLGNRRKQRAFTEGLIALAEGDFLQARKHLSLIEHEDFDGINLLAAADAELRLGNPEGARENWRLARTYDKSALAASMMLINDDLVHQRESEALSAIESLSKKQQTDRKVIQLWAQALVQAGKWQELKKRLENWKKPLGEHYANFAQQASQGHFAEIASKEGASQLKLNWEKQSRSVRKDPAQQAAYIQQLINQGMHSDAEQALIAYQKSAPHPLLLPLFRQIKLPNPAASIRKLESWIKKDDKNVELLSILGHLAYHTNDISLAEKALSKAIKLGQRQQDLLLMATIKESQQQDHQALALYKQSMGQTG